MPSRRRNSRPCRRGPFERLESRLPLAADITTGLVHHWTFDETTGNTAADSAGDSDGTLNNWSPTESKWEPGRVGGALRFGTGDNYVLAPQQPASGSYSVSFWLNVAERNAIHPRILNARTGNTIYINNESNLGVSFSANETANTFSPEAPTYNAWEHYAVNFNAATGQGVIYRSGAPVAIGTYIDTSSMPNWTIGHHFDITNHDQSLRGALDDLRVYDRLLTDEDVAALAALGSPAPVQQEPIHHWTFDETTGFTANDSAGDADALLLNWNANEPRWEPGKIGGAVRITTTDNAIVTPPASTGPQWSIAFWANLSGGDRFPRVIGPGDGRDLWSFFDLENQNGLGFQSHNVLISDPLSPTFGVWAHYAINFDSISDIGTIYRNGVQVASGFFPDNSPKQPWVIGHTSDLGNHEHTLLGLLDDLRVYDRLLAVTEIQELAQVAVNDDYATDEDLLLDISAVQGLIANDTSAPPGAKATIETEPLHGDLILNEDGSFTYDPDNDYNGPDSFTYRLTDPEDNSSVATVALTVTPVNDAPIFNFSVEQFLTSDEQPRVFRSNGDPVPSTTFPEWTANRAPGAQSAADEANQTLTLSVSNDNNALFADQPSVDHNGTLYFTPAPNASGTAVLSVTLKDNGGTALGGVDTITQTIEIMVVKPHRLLNAADALDVLPDGDIAANDALEIINFLNALGSQPVPPNVEVGAPFLDVTGDNVIAANDALQIINALNAGIFTVPDLPGSASFVGLDTTTQGNWQGKYGSAGYALSSAQTSVLPMARLSFTGALTDLYDGRVIVADTDPRALQIPGTTDRVAATWSGDHGFTLDINLSNDGQSRQVALYMLDILRNNRSQRLEVIDATTDQVLDTRDLSDFGDGKYLVWNLRGHVKIRFSNLANGLNAVLSGIFFD